MRYLLILHILNNEILAMRIIQIFYVSSFTNYNSINENNEFHQQKQ